MKIIDLTQSIEDNMEVYPGDPEVKIEVTSTYQRDNYLVRQLTLGSHTGTHVDAFSHMDKSGESLDQIPLERFCGRAYLVAKEDKFPINKGLLFKEVVGLDSLDKIMAAQPNFIGGPISEELERTLLNNKIITFTGLVNLESLPSNKPFMFYGVPLKINEADGSPVRAIAILEE